MTSRRGTGWKRACVGFFLVFSLTGLGGSRLSAQEKSTREYEIKAAFLYNFVRLTEWPTPSRASGTICVLGQDPFGPSMGSLIGRQVGRQTIGIRYLVDPREVNACGVLFISASEQDGLAGILDALAGLGVLTVGETEGFARRGGMIEMKVSGNKIRLELNVTAIRDAGLAVSSQLLNVSSVVR